MEAGCPNPGEALEEDEQVSGGVIFTCTDSDASKRGDKMAKKNLAYINKEMLIWARNETPFVIGPEQVSLRFPRMSAEKISRWEAGEELPSVRTPKVSEKIYTHPFVCFYV